MNNQMLGKIMTFVFIGLALGVWGYFIQQMFEGVGNLWIFTSGTLLWLLGVANAKINELCDLKGN
jgi:hypothetical protein